MAVEDPVRVVNLPDPEPAAPHPNGGHIPAIPDDVVREIATFLDFEDRLSLSLTSHHMYAVVQPRLQEIVVEAPRLNALHKWIFEDPDVRGPQLRALVFVAPPVYWSWFDRSRYSTAVQFCLDIIGRASRLEELSCAPFLSHGLSSQNLQGLTRLKSLHLGGCTGEILASLRLPATLATLHLSDNPSGTVLPFRRILRSIYHLFALRTLVLERLSLPDEYGDDVDTDDGATTDGDVDGVADCIEDTDADTDASNDDGADADEDAEGEDEEDGNHHGPGSADALIISSVRTLKTLEQQLPPCVSLATTFPNLQTLCLDGSTHLNTETEIIGTLQHLIVSNSFQGEQVRWFVNHLTYILGSTGPNDDLFLDSACDPTHLVSLTIQLVFISFLVWDKVTGYASSIRLLEIESLETPLPDYISLFHKQFNPVAPVALPLLCLSILAPSPSIPPPADTEETRNVFLDRAFKYLPSLRYVALACAHSTASEMSTYQDDYAEVSASWRWWRVLRDDDGTPVEIREIPCWEGERVRAYLRDGDREAAERFDDNFVALR